MFGTVKKKLREICAGGETVLWFSGGKDSRLLLELMLAQKLPFSILCFDDGWTRDQRRVVDDVIKRHNLRVYSYLPQSVYLFGAGGELTVAAHYAVGNRGETIPVLRDFVHQEKACGLEKFQANVATSANTPVFFANHILGSKRREKHYAFGGRDTVTNAEFEVGGARFFCPLYFWNNADVSAALGKLGIKNAQTSAALDTGNIPACHSCLLGEAFCPKEQKTIPAVEWDAAQNLANWRAANNVR